MNALIISSLIIYTLQYFIILFQLNIRKFAFVDLFIELADLFADLFNTQGGATFV